MRTRRRFLAAAMLALLVLVACGEEDSGAGTAVSVEAFDFYFEPTTIPVDPGESVQINFANNGEVLHSFTVPDADFEVEVEGGESIAEVLSVPDQPGALDFYCEYHPDEMKGTISVGGADEPIEEDVDSEDEDDEDVEVEVEDDDGDVTGTEEDTNY